MEKLTIHEKTFDIRWGDMDALGHVNNGRFFEYFQEARIELLQEMNITMTETTGPIVINAACTFLKPVLYPARITLRSSLHSLGRSSMIMDHDVYQNDNLMAQGACKIVWVDYLQNKSVPLPESIRQLFES